MKFFLYPAAGLGLVLLGYVFRMSDEVRADPSPVWFIVAFGGSILICLFICVGMAVERSSRKSADTHPEES